MAKSSRVKSKGKSKSAPTKKAKAKAKAKAPIKAKAKPAPKKKAAPMKAAAKKAAPKKKAPPAKKAAPKKVAQKLPPAKGAGNAGATTSSAVDEGWGDDHRKQVEQHVLRLYQSTIDPDAALPTVLSVDPNDHDLDPSPFYEALEDAFKVEDPSKHEFAGYGGTIEHTINFIAGRWRGGALKQSGDDTFE